MRSIIRSKAFKILYILSITAIFMLVILYTQNVIFTASVEHGLLLSKTDNINNYKYTIMIDGKMYEFLSRDKAVELNPGVINFKYRGHTIVEFSGYIKPVIEKIMSRDTNSLELEYKGNIGLSDNLTIYKQSTEDTSVSNPGKIVIGTGNNEVYLDKSGKIKTIIIKGDCNIDTVRVGIKNQDFQSLDHDELKFVCDSPIKIEDKKDKKVITIPSETEITMTPKEDGISIAYPGNNQLFKNRTYISSQDDESYVKVLSYKRLYGEPAYRGIFEVTALSGKLRLINEVSLENYLCQVVPSEMPSSFGLEALKAQAVAARTYAISGILNSGFYKLGFHVDDSTLSQVYNNISENKTAAKAVNETKGLIMKYNGQIIDAKYYSTSHGYGSTSDETWSSDEIFPGNKVPYLTAQSYLLDGREIDLSSEDNALKFFKDWTLKSYDSNSPYFRWKVTFTKDELKNTIEKNLPLAYSGDRNFILTLAENQYESKDIPDNCLGDLINLEVTRRSQGGNIMELVITGTNGTYKVIKELNVRYVIRPRKQDTGSDKDIIIKRRTPDNGRKPEDLKNSSLLPSAFMVFDIAKDKQGSISSVTFYGGGYGHSVGMSQYGASYLASKGYKFDKILETYYKGIELEKAY